MRVFKAVTKISVLGLLAALLSVPALATSAQAGQFGGGSTSTGYTVSVRIHFYGSGVRGGSVTRSVEVHPTCYWAPADGPYTDAVAMLAWYDEVTGGQQTRGLVDEYGPRSEWKKEADAEAAGTADISWYRAHCDNPDDYTKFGVGSVEGVDPIEGNNNNYVTFLYHPFNAGEAIPQPRVSPEELARVARDQLRIQKPNLERNPKIDSAGAPTLVGLPTWFWVTNPLAVGISPGNPVGTLDVTAELNQPDGRVWATVTAKTGGLHLDSAFGSTECDPARALIAYSAALTDNEACTVVFSHAKQGLAVRASTSWNATWVGSDGPGDTALAPATQGATIAVDVAEVQNIVTR